MLDVVHRSDERNHLVHISPQPKQVHANGSHPDYHQGQSHSFRSGDILRFLRKHTRSYETRNHSENTKHNGASDYSGRKKTIRFDHLIGGEEGSNAKRISLANYLFMIKYVLF
jgi:hypothetical protein